MSDTILLMRRIGSTSVAIDLFEKSEKPASLELNRIRVFLEELFWEHTVWFYPRDFLGYYQVDRINRVINGMWPVNYVEVVFLLMYVSYLVFDTPTIDSSLNWIKDCGKYSRHIDLDKWRESCDFFEKLIQGSLVAQYSP